jgi:threonine/homoserine/homoserine lactone efflux protein
MALLTLFFSSFLIALSGAMMPGPLLTATIGEASRRGLFAGPLLTVGHGILELFMVAALLLGLAPYLRQPGVFVAIALSGAFILLWMAFSMFRSLPTLALRSEAGAGPRGNLLFRGIILSVVNPYWVIWWATIGFGYILHCDRFGIAGIASFFAGHILADFIWYSAVSGAVAGGRRFLSNRLYRGVIGGCAVILIVFAGYFFYSAFQKLIEL